MRHSSAAPAHFRLVVVGRCCENEGVLPRKFLLDLDQAPVLICQFNEYVSAGKKAFMLASQTFYDEKFHFWLANLQGTQNCFHQKPRTTDVPPTKKTDPLNSDDRRLARRVSSSYFLSTFSI